MSKLNLVNRVPAEYNRATWTDIISAICNQTNNLAEGKITGRHYTNTIAPNTSLVSALHGDIVWDSNPTVIGSVAPGVASSYVRLGWVCVADGTPGTWKEMRVLVGT